MQSCSCAFWYELWILCALKKFNNNVTNISRKEKNDIFKGIIAMGIKKPSNLI